MFDRKHKPERYTEYTALNAKKYHSWYLHSPGSDIARLQKEAISKILGSGAGERLLDIGCGTGFFSEWFHSIGFSVTGIDVSNEMIARARLESNEGVLFQVADAKMIPYEDDSFDIVTFVTSFEFMTDPDAVIKEALRIVSGEITFLMLNPNHELNVGRIRKAETSGGVFRRSRLWTPAEMESQLEKYLPDSINMKTNCYSDDSPYYLLQVQLR